MGAVPNAPTNGSLQGVSLTVAGAGSRTGGQVSYGNGGNLARPSGYALTAGPSLSPGTANLQLTSTKNLFTLPYVGYFLNTDRAICKAILGK